MKRFHSKFQQLDRFRSRPPAQHNASSFPASPSLESSLLQSVNTRQIPLAPTRSTPSPTVAFQKKLEDSSRGRSVPGSSAPSPSARKNVRRGQARARGRSAGVDPVLLRGPQAGGRGVPAAGRGRGGGAAQDPAQERRHEGGDAAGGLRNCAHRVREAQHGEGHRGVHKEGVRQEPRPNLALHRRPQLRFLRDTRDKLLCIFLHRL